MSSGWSPPSPPGAERGRSDEGPSGASLSVGIVAVLLGVAGVVLAERYKLDAERALLGGAYLKDGYRIFLIAGGASLAVLGCLLVLLTGVGAQRSSVRGLLIACIVLGSLVAAAEAISITAVAAQNREQSESFSGDDGESWQSDESESPRPPDGGETVSCGATGDCYADDEPVLPVRDGDMCVTPGGDVGNWIAQDQLQTSFRCMANYE